MKNRGLTFIEILVTISITVILVTALAFSFQGWMGKYRVESQIKEMYVDFMNTRSRAMQKNRMHFVSLATNQYTIYEDTNPAPDGNEALEPASDTQVLQTNINPLYTIVTDVPTPNRIRFTVHGLVMPADLPGSGVGTIRLSNSSDPDYDCIAVSETRVNLGKWDGSNCVTK
jgi:Tfp pilus assembly protein FimT